MFWGLRAESARLDCWAGGCAHSLLIPRPPVVSEACTSTALKWLVVRKSHVCPTFFEMAMVGRFCATLNSVGIAAGAFADGALS